MCERRGRGRSCDGGAGQCIAVRDGQRKGCASSCRMGRVSHSGRAYASFNAPKSSGSWRLPGGSTDVLRCSSGECGDQSFVGIPEGKVLSRRKNGANGVGRLGKVSQNAPFFNNVAPIFLSSWSTVTHFHRAMAMIPQFPPFSFHSPPCPLNSPPFFHFSPFFGKRPERRGMDRAPHSFAERVAEGGRHVAGSNAAAPERDALCLTALPSLSRAFLRSSTPSLLSQQLAPSMGIPFRLCTSPHCSLSAPRRARVPQHPAACAPRWVGGRIPCNVPPPPPYCPVQPFGK